MILIDNLKIIRNIIFLTKINNNLKNYKYIIFCSNTKITPELNKLIAIHHIKYYTLKKSKSIKYINFLKTYLNNFTMIFCSNNINSIQVLINSINQNILFCKIENSFYSLENINLYFNSNINLINNLDNYFINFLNILNYTQNLKKN